MLHVYDSISQMLISLTGIEEPSEGLKMLSFLHILQIPYVKPDLYLNSRYIIYLDVDTLLNTLTYK